MPRIRFASFSPDRRLLAACTTPDSSVKLWDIEGGTELRVLSGHLDSVYAAVFSPDGAWLATCSADQTVKLWEVSTGNLLRPSEAMWTRFGTSRFLRGVSSSRPWARMGHLNCGTPPEAARDSLPEPLSPLGFDMSGDLLGQATNGVLVAVSPESLRPEHTAEMFPQPAATRHALGALLDGGNVLPALVTERGIER